MSDRDIGELKPLGCYVFDGVSKHIDLMTAVVFGRLYYFAGKNHGPTKFLIDKCAITFGISQDTVMRCVQKMLKAGLISRQRNSHWEPYLYSINRSLLATWQNATSMPQSATTYVASCDPRGSNQRPDSGSNLRPVYTDHTDPNTEGNTESEPTPSKPTTAYLESANEVMAKMEEWINKNRVRHPVLDSVDVAMEADGLYLKYRTKKVDADALVDTWMRQIVSARETKQATVAYSGKAPVMSIRDGAQKDGVELDRVFGFMDDLKQAYLEVKHDA